MTHTSNVPGNEMSTTISGNQLSLTRMVSGGDSRPGVKGNQTISSGPVNVHVLLDAFGVALEGLVHLIDSEDELGGENILGHQVRELEGQVQAVVVEEPDRVLFHRELGDDSFKLGTDSWDMLAQEKV